MPQTGLLSSSELASVRQSWWRISQAGGVTYVDDAAYIEGHGAANAVAAWFNTAGSMANIGIRRAEAMVSRYAHYGQLAAQGRRLGVRVYVVSGYPGTIQIDGLDTVSPEVELAGMIEAGLLDVAAAESFATSPEDPVAASAEGYGAASLADRIDVASLPMGAPGIDGIDPVQAMLLELAKEAARTVGQDLYNWTKGLINDAQSIDSKGNIYLDHRDKLICYLDNVDDQAFVYLDGKLLSARSQGQKGTWDTAWQLAPGSHLLVIEVKNSNWWGWSYRCLLGRAWDYRPDGPKRPVLPLQGGAAAPGDGPRQFTRIFFVRVNVG